SEACAMPSMERGEVLRLLAYCSDPEDLIPDHVAVIGLLDDAIMLELLLRQIRHVVQAWDEFCHARERMPAAAGAEQRIAQARELAQLREQLHARMHENTLREAMAQAAAAAGMPSPDTAPSE